MPVLPSAKKLKDLGGHLGHLRKVLHPTFKPYVAEIKNKVVFIDTKKTVDALALAVDFLKSHSKEKVLWVGTKVSAKDMIKEIGEELNHPYVAEKWLGGMITNFETLRKNLERLESLRSEEKSQRFKEMTKKEKRLLQQKRERLEKVLAGLVDLKEVPQIMVVVDPAHEKIAVQEAYKKGLTVVAIADANADLTHIDYPIPLNDESRLALREVLKTLARCFDPKFSFAEKTKKKK